MGNQCCGDRSSPDAPGAKILVRIPADARVRNHWTTVLNSTPGLHLKILRDLYAAEHNTSANNEDITKMSIKKLEAHKVSVNNVKAYTVDVTFEVVNEKGQVSNHRGFVMVTSTGEVHSFVDDPEFDE